MTLIHPPLKTKLREITGEDLNGVEVKVAVNRKYAKKPVMLKNGDEVALIPPVQGG